MFNSVVHLKYSQCAQYIVKYNIYVYYYAYIVHKINLNRFKSDHRLGEFRIFIGKPEYLERMEYWQQHG